MSLMKKYQEIARHSKDMDLQPPAKEEEIIDFQETTGILLPEDLKSLLRLFNGGELFVPGTTIFGLSRRGKVPSLQEVNANRDNGIPLQYMVFAMLNFGDYICIATDGSEKVLQWDHEQGKEDAEWTCLEDWLASEAETLL